ncbi:unnamed protein product [Chrysoparadoxa australica]
MAFIKACGALLCICGAARAFLGTTPSVAQHRNGAHVAWAGKGEDLLQSPQFLAKKAEMLQKQLDTLIDKTDAAKAEADAEWEEWGGQITRLQGEFTVLKQRTLNDTMEAATDAKVKVLKELLPISDNFERASASIIPETPGEKAVTDYFDGLRKMLLDEFESLGMTPVPTVGEPFDYNMHEAVMREPSDLEEDTVTKEFQKGRLIFLLPNVLSQLSLQCLRCHLCFFSRFHCGRETGAASYGSCCCLI